MTDNEKYQIELDNEKYIRYIMKSISWRDNEKYQINRDLMKSIR